MRHPPGISKMDTEQPGRPRGAGTSRQAQVVGKPEVLGEHLLGTRCPVPHLIPLLKAYQEDTDDGPATLKDVSTSATQVPQQPLIYRKQSRPRQAEPPQDRLFRSGPRNPGK